MAQPNRPQSNAGAQHTANSSLGCKVHGLSEDEQHWANSEQHGGGKGWQQCHEGQHTSTGRGAGEHDMQHCRQLAG